MILSFLGMKDYCAKICVEAFRVQLFLDAGVGDLSGKEIKDETVFPHFTANLPLTCST